MDVPPDPARSGLKPFARDFDGFHVGTRAHIVHVVHSLGMGGLENGVVNLVNRLPTDRYRFTILALEPVWTLRERLRDGGVACVPLGGGGPLLPLRLPAALRRLRPDLVHTRNWATIEGIPASRMAGVPRVVHGEHGLNADEAAGMKRRRVAGRRLAYLMADRIVTVAESIRSRLVASGAAHAEKVRSIQNGVDTDRFRPGRERGAMRRTLGIAGTASVIGAVGRLDPVKGHEHLLHAFAEVRAERPDARLVVTGEGPERERLRSLAGELGLGGSFLLTGARAEIDRLYPAFDVFAQPSLTEGMSNTLLEAMACGLPAVATDVGGNPELIEHGATGLLVPPGRPREMARALESILADGDLRARMAAAARSRAESAFSLDRMVGAYDRLYEGLLRPPARATA